MIKFLTEDKRSYATFLPGNRRLQPYHSSSSVSSAAEVGEEPEQTADREDHRAGYEDRSEGGGVS